MHLFYKVNEKLSLSSFRNDLSGEVMGTKAAQIEALGAVYLRLIKRMRRITNSGFGIG